MALADKIKTDAEMTQLPPEGIGVLFWGYDTGKLGGVPGLRLLTSDGVFSNVLGDIPQDVFNKIEQNSNDITTLQTTKVDKVDGKSLIADSEITRLATVKNYDDSQIKADVTKLQNEKANLTDLTIYLKSEDAKKTYATKDELPVVPENITTQGNTFNVANKLVKLDSVGKIPSTLYTQPDISPLATKTELAAKVDKVPGKSLIADDEITRLSTIKNYDDTKIKQAISTNADDISQLKTNKADKSELPDVSLLATKTELAGKVDKKEGFSLVADTEITRLATVKNYDDTKVKEDITALQTGKADKTEIPTVPDNITTQGNTFNGTSQLVQLDTQGKLPAGLMDAEKISVKDTENKFTATNVEGALAELATAQAETPRVPIGSIFAAPFTPDWTPVGAVLCDGAEYSADQFPDLWRDYLISSPAKVLTCTYEEFLADVNKATSCVKFAVDTTKRTFKVPLLAPGTFIESGDGTVHEAGLPEIEGERSARGDVGLGEGHQSGAFSQKGLQHGSCVGFTRESGWDLKFKASLSNPIYGKSDTVQPKSISMCFYVQVANGSVNQSQMDWSQWTTGLQGKANADLSNVATAHITETWHSGNSWYRVWSDGFIEQGGQFEKKDWGTSWATVSLIKPFTSTEYHILTSCELDTPNYYGTFQIKQGSKKRSSFETCPYHNHPNLSGDWYAFGY